MSAPTKPIVCVRPVTMLLARLFRRYPSLFAVASTFIREALLTEPYPPRARAAVACETPASRATSVTVGAPRGRRARAFETGASAGGLVITWS
jgi:hypothetical protein